jgi:L-galactose dehydrogenase
MQFTTLGKTGLTVSKLGLGGAPLAGGYERHSPDAADITRVIHEAIDHGINFIDTAPLYGDGESELRIGHALRGRREGVIIASKAVRRDWSYGYASTIESVEASLTRLQTDWIDIIQIHDVELQNPHVIINETLPALERLREDGKIRFIGVTTRDLSLLQQYMESNRFDCIQFYTRYMLIDHTAKDNVLPKAKERNVGVINGSVLGMGLLADAPAAFLPGSIIAEANHRMEKLAFLRKNGQHGLVEPAMRFSLSHPDIHVTLSGISSLDMLRTNLSYCDGVGLIPHEQIRVYEMFEGRKLLE